MLHIDLVALAILFPQAPLSRFLVRIAQRQQQLSEGHRPTSVPLDATIEQVGQCVSRLAREHAVGEGEVVVLELGLPARVERPRVLFPRIGPLMALHQRRSLPVQHRPGQPDQPSARRQVDVLRIGDALLEQGDEFRQVDVPRVKGVVAEHLQHDGDAAVERIDEHLMLRLLQFSQFDQMIHVLALLQLAVLMTEHRGDDVRAQFHLVEYAHADLPLSLDFVVLGHLDGDDVDINGLGSLFLGIAGVEFLLFGLLDGDFDFELLLHVLA